MNTQEIIFVEEDSAACDGSKGELNHLPGHPKIYLTFKTSDRMDTIVCPYCSQHFKRKPHAPSSKKVKAKE